MVKGISRQVIVVQSPDPELFEQAIFILKHEAVGKGITDELLLKEAQRAIRGKGKDERKRNSSLYGPVWAYAGAVLTGLIWLLTILL